MLTVIDPARQYEPLGRVLLLHGEPAAQRSAGAARVCAQALVADPDAVTCSDPDSLVAAVAAAAHSARSLLLIIDPDVSLPIDVARRVARNWPTVPVLIAVDASRLDATRRLVERAGPSPSQWRLRAADDPDLLRAITTSLSDVAAQRQLRDTLERLKLRLSNGPAADEAEYHRLIESDRYLATALQSAHDAVVTLDRAGKVASTNRGAHALFEMSAADIKGEWLAGRFADAPAFDAACGLALLNGNTTTVFRTAPPGQERFLEATFDRISDTIGAPIGLVVVLRDVTARQQAEAEQRAGYERKDEFFTMLGHELRNPLAPIRSAAQLLSRLALDDARAVRAVDIILRQTALMSGLLEDLLDVARVSRGGLELYCQPVSVPAVVSDALEQSRVLVDQKRQQVRVDVPDAAACDVVGDRKRLVQVFANLLTNAAKYTNDGGHINVRVTSDDEMVEVRVADDGIGIAPDMLPRVFDLFSQVDPNAERSRGGLGLGLALVKALVDKHGGTVSAESAGAGHGSAFVVTLPRWVGGSGTA